MFDDSSFLDDGDGFGVADGAQAVSDDHGGPISHDPVERFLDDVLGLGVQRAGRFVEEENSRVLEDRPGNGDPLLLAAGELSPVLAHHRVEPVWHLVDELGRVRQLRRGANLFQCCAFFPVGDVFSDAGGEESWLLTDEPDLPSDPPKLQVSEIDSVDEDGPRLGIVEPLDQAHDGRLAAAALAHQSYRRAAGDEERESGEDSLVRASRVAEMNVSQLDLPAYVVQGLSLLVVGVDFWLSFDGFEHLEARRFSRGESSDAGGRLSQRAEIPERER